MVGGGDDPGSSKRSWACPNDRHLTLRAQLKKGWCVKSEQSVIEQNDTKLTEEEQAAILAVVERADIVDRQEMERIGRIIERLENMRRNARGTGINDCLLCAKKLILFGGVFSNLARHCHDCKKAVCTKCSVEVIAEPSTSSGRPSTSLKESYSRRKTFWRCKLCAELREMWETSGAWFRKQVPDFILPEGAAPVEEQPREVSRHYLENSTFIQVLNAKSPEWKAADSSSPEEEDTEIKKAEDTSANRPRYRARSLSPVSDKRRTAFVSVGPSVNAMEDEEFQEEEGKASGNKGCRNRKGKHGKAQEQQGYPRVTCESSGSSTSGMAARRSRSSEPGRSREAAPMARSAAANYCSGEQMMRTSDYAQAAAQSMPSHRRHGSQRSLSAYPIYWSESESSLSGKRNVPEDVRDDQEEARNVGESSDQEGARNLGELSTVDFTMERDSENKFIHVTLRMSTERGKSRTVHQTRNPEFSNVGEEGLPASPIRNGRTRGRRDNPSGPIVTTTYVHLENTYPGMPKMENEKKNNFDRSEKAKK